MQSSCIPPAPTRGEIRRFPRAPARDLPASDRVVVFHQGRAVAFDTPADMHQALIEALRPDISRRERIAEQKAETADRMARDYAAGLERVQSLTRDAQAALDAARAKAEANAVRHRDQLVQTAILAFAAGVGLMILLGGGL